MNRLKGGGKQNENLHRPRPRQEDPGRAIGLSGTYEKKHCAGSSEELAATAVPAPSSDDPTDDRHRGANQKADLSARTTLANREQANLFVSIHCNSAASAEATGIETFALAPGGQGEKLARSIQTELIRETGLTDRGVKFANYRVLRDTAMPAVLVELGFINNPAEEKLLRDPAWQEKAARAIAIGIMSHVDPLLGYVGQIGEGSNVDIKVEVKGEKIPGRLIDGQTWVPLRELIKVLNYEVLWDEADRTAVVK